MVCWFYPLSSTIHKYGERIRHLEHVNNRLHGQATHYTLGTAPNTPDDDKLHHCSQPSSPTPSRPPNQISPLTTTPITSAHPHSLPLPSPHSRAPADSSNSSSLSRRKWLQPSDPGLILGTPPDSPGQCSWHILLLGLVTNLFEGCLIDVQLL